MSWVDVAIPVASALVALTVGAVGGYRYRKDIAEAKVARAEDAVRRMIDDAQKRA